MSLDEAIEQLREMNEPVPHPLRLPTPEEVNEAEAELGVKFHPDFRQYLLQASDVVVGAMEPATITEPEAHTHLQTMCEEAWGSGMPKDYLPICEDNGDYYCMDRKGQVVFDSSDGATDETWANLAEWIEEVWIGQS